ncbi:MAG: hypothetical protein C4533_08250 [Candidatus Omnitrophota bacterium]|jgi:uncharacterized GH25 family protein|nr:MAG: hypothetical protein C4533_08250 [Candidatus Omnitrophota bacterium]
MKKILFVILLVLFFASSVFAHPPTRIEISYDKSTSILTAKITHPVEDPDRHYVSKVDVAVNGKEILEHKLSRQDNADYRIVTYLIPDVKEGDTISVEGYCSIMGKKEEGIKVK